MSDDERIAAILTECCERQNRGEPVEPEALLQAHPELAPELRRAILALGFVDVAFGRTEAIRPSTPDRIGPYRIVREIGTGGMGTVYLAEVDGEVRRLERGTRVALKVLHPHLLGRAGFFQRFLREAQAGRQVRHENVVHTLDVDAALLDTKQVNYLVLEYVEGRTLGQLLRDHGRVPEALLREIALQIASGLAAIHAAGIVHRDLKPANLIITDDQRVRIMDLGVARVVEESRTLTREGEFAGSLHYAAPEQFGNQGTGPTADLYSLGVVLYELATGENPFRWDDPAKVIAKHTTEMPPPLGERHALSPYLGEILATLLAKRPEDRFASAEELRRVLEDGERSDWWVVRERELRQDIVRLPRVPVRRETKLYGREADLEQLRGAWRRARDGDGNTVLLEGEAGIGKSRVVDALLRELDKEDVHVLYGSYPPAGGLGGLSDAVLEHFGANGLEEALRPYLTVTPGLVPAFAALVKHDQPPVGIQPLEGDVVHAVFCHAMRALAKERPLLWIVEDLHFASGDSRAMVLSLARAAAGHRVLLLTTTRPHLADDELTHFSRLENFRRLALSRLGARDVILLLQDAFRSEALAEKLGAKIALKSDGIPFFVFEVIRGLKEGQFITELPDGSYVESKVIEKIEVPSAVRDLVELRLRDLTRVERAVLDVGAVQGFEFEPALVARVLDRKRIEILQVLADVERRSGMVFGQAGSCRFDHHQIQEVVYEDLPPDLCAEYHALLAEAHVERCGDDPKGDDAVFLAHHHLHGSCPRQALPHLEPAFDHLQENYRNEALLDLARSALGSQGLLEGKERAEVLFRQALRLNLLGRHDEEHAAFERALALADETDDEALRGRIRQGLGAHFVQTSQNDSAKNTLLEALELADAAGDRSLEANATMSLSGLSHNLGRYSDAWEQCERSRDIFREIGNRAGEACATVNLGCCFHDLGRYREAQEHHERGAALSREIGHRLFEANAVLNLGRVFGELGRYAEAREHYERARVLYREIGNRHGEAIATGNVGVVFEALGRYAEAKKHHERKRALCRETGDRRSEAHATVSLGCVSSCLGQADLARETLSESLRVLREIGARPFEVHALQDLGEVAEQRGDLEGARRFYKDALTLGREISYKSRVTTTLLVLGRLEASQDEERAAISYLDEARALAEKLGEPDSILLATVYRSLLPGGNAETALAALAECEERADHATKREARFRLWELTKDKTHLAEAKRLLDFAVEHSPEECRTSMIENVPLHQDIMKAWEEHGENE